MDEENLSERVAKVMGWTHVPVPLNGGRWQVLREWVSPDGLAHRAHTDYLLIENAITLMGRPEWPHDEEEDGGFWQLACDGPDSWWVENHHLFSGVNVTSMIGLSDNPAEALCLAFLTLHEEE